MFENKANVFVETHYNSLLGWRKYHRSLFIPLENHGFGDRPFLPSEVGHARALALMSLA